MLHLFFFPLILSNNVLIASYTRNVITEVKTKVKRSSISLLLYVFWSYPPGCRADIYLSFVTVNIKLLHVSVRVFRSRKS